MTAFRIVDSNNENVKTILREMEEVSPLGKAILNRSELILTEPALVFDSVFVFAKGLEKAVVGGPALKMA